jgi:hypothetical protein
VSPLFDRYALPIVAVHVMMAYYWTMLIGATLNEHVLAIYDDVADVFDELNLTDRKAQSLNVHRLNLPDVVDMGNGGVADLDMPSR